MGFIIEDKHLIKIFRDTGKKGDKYTLKKIIVRCLTLFVFVNTEYSQKASNSTFHDSGRKMHQSFYTLQDLHVG